MLLKWPVRLDWGRSSISGLRESARRHTHDLSLAHLESLDVQSCSAGRGASATLVQRQVATARRAQLAQHIAQSSVRLRSLRPQHLVHVGDTFLLATQFVTVRYSNTASDPRNQQFIFLSHRHHPVKQEHGHRNFSLERCTLLCQKTHRKTLKI